jgi:hypothetical protein
LVVKLLERPATEPQALAGTLVVVLVEDVEGCTVALVSLAGLYVTTDKLSPILELPTAIVPLSVRHSTDALCVPRVSG